MGALRKMAVYLGLYEGEDEEQYDDDYDDVRRDVRRRSDPRDRYADRDDEREDRYASRSVRPIPDSRAVRTFRGDSGRGDSGRGESGRGDYDRSDPGRGDYDRRGPAGAMGDRRPVAADISRIEMVHPRSYNDARRIGEDYRDGIPVIMNVSDLDDADAKRIIDFAAGLVFGLRGSIERVTNKVFLLSPPNVELGAQARAQLEQDGFFNQS